MKRLIFLNLMTMLIGLPIYGMEQKLDFDKPGEILGCIALNPEAEASVLKLLSEATKKQRLEVFKEAIENEDTSEDFLKKLSDFVLITRDDDNFALSAKDEKEVEDMRKQLEVKFQNRKKSGPSGLNEFQRRALLRKRIEESWKEDPETKTAVAVIAIKRQKKAPSVFPKKPDSFFPQNSITNNQSSSDLSLKSAEDGTYIAPTFYEVKLQGKNDDEKQNLNTTLQEVERLKELEKIRNTRKQSQKLSEELELEGKIKLKDGLLDLHRKKIEEYPFLQEKIKVHENKLQELKQELNQLKIKREAEEAEKQKDLHLEFAKHKKSIEIKRDKRMDRLRESEAKLQEEQKKIDAVENKLNELNPHIIQQKKADLQKTLEIVVQKEKEASRSESEEDAQKIQWKRDKLKNLREMLQGNPALGELIGQKIRKNEEKLEAIVQQQSKNQDKIVQERIVFGSNCAASIQAQLKSLEEEAIGAHRTELLKQKKALEEIMEQLKSDHNELLKSWERTQRATKIIMHDGLKRVYKKDPNNLERNKGKTHNKSSTQGQ